MPTASAGAPSAGEGVRRGFWKAVRPRFLRDKQKNTDFPANVLPPRAKEILNQGKVVFTTESTKSHVKREAHFAVVRSSCPMESLKGLLVQWEMTRPSVLISVTGSAKLSVSSQRLEFIKHGLAMAVRATNSWVVTGGTDEGVMELTGQAMRQVANTMGMTDAVTPCIGIAGWRKVTHRDRFYKPKSESRDSTRDSASMHSDLDERSDYAPQPLPPPSAATSPMLSASLLADVDSDSRCEPLPMASMSGGGSAGGEASAEPVIYVKRRKNSQMSAGLDPNHTHFFLVDDQREDWGGEIKLRAEFESELSREFGVPLVMLVLEGGPGTYETVVNAINQGHMVVVVKESGGAAQTIAEYVEPADTRSTERLFDADAHVVHRPHLGPGTSGHCWRTSPLALTQRCSRRRSSRGAPVSLPSAYSALSSPGLSRPSPPHLHSHPFPGTSSLSQCSRSTTRA